MFTVGNLATIMLGVVSTRTLGKPYLLGAALLGAILLVGADTVARTIVAPAEMPIGILTAAIGAPFFLAMLLRQRGLVSL